MFSLQVFREPRKASQLDQVLSSYAASIKVRCRFFLFLCVYLNFQRIVLAINHFLLFLYRQNFAVSSSSSNGAVLFCVVGGKMSEGINFSDDLGR